MPLFEPMISPEIFAMCPDFRALSIHAEGVVNRSSPEETTSALAAACRELCPAIWAEAHREAWRSAYRAFGAKPQRTPSSAEALLKRVQRDGSLPPVNAVVNLYNAVSLRYAVPVGGENAAAYTGPPLLCRAAGNEPFDTVQAGSSVTEHPEPGEVVWRDATGVTCRRWNWRQGARTRIETSTNHMWFILEALDPMPETALREAGRELMAGLRTLSPTCVLSASLLDQAGARVIPNP